MRIAVIETGGKQYLVSPGQVITIEKIRGLSGKDISFDKVLLVDDGKEVKIGTPYVAGARVSGELMEEGRGDKKLVFKYKAKTRHRVKRGHRQPFMKVKIEGKKDVAPRKARAQK